MFYEDADVLICTSVNSPINYPNIILKIGSLTSPFYKVPSPGSSNKLKLVSIRIGITIISVVY